MQHCATQLKSSIFQIVFQRNTGYMYNMDGMGSKWTLKLPSEPWQVGGPTLITMYSCSRGEPKKIGTVFLSYEGASHLLLQSILQHWCLEPCGDASLLCCLPRYNVGTPFMQRIATSCLVQHMQALQYNAYCNTSVWNHVMHPRCAVCQDILWVVPSMPIMQHSATSCLV